jgi:hypothetical protein
VIRISDAFSQSELRAINFNTSVQEVPALEVIYGFVPPPTLPPQPVPIVPTPP